MYRCQCCLGTKKSIGLGGVASDCKACDATGFVKELPKVDVIQELAQFAVPELPKVDDDRLIDIQDMLSKPEPKAKQKVEYKRKKVVGK